MIELSIIDKNSIDGIAYNRDNKALMLLITDHLDWKDEYNHLIMLQEKINNYIHYCETKQYLNVYNQEKILMAVIDIHFLVEPSKKAFDFLQEVQNQVGQLGIKIQCTISGESDEC